jgi:hypothetical protein
MSDLEDDDPIDEEPDDEDLPSKSPSEPEEDDQR